MNEYLAFDTTSITSYGALIKQAKYGKNKEGDSLPQINLALLYGEESMFPVCIPADMVVPYNSVFRCDIWKWSIPIVCPS